MSEGEIPIRVEFIGFGTLEGLIIRYLGPISADAILDKMPFVLRGRFSFGAKDYWIMMNVGIRKGPDSKATINVEKGDIVYNPKTDEISLIIEGREMPNKINKIGKVTKNLNLLQEARNGLNCKLSKLN
jgi:hypothetical protein